MSRGVKGFFKRNFLILSILVLGTAWFVFSYFTEGIFYRIIYGDVDYVRTTIESFGGLSYFVFIAFVILEVVVAIIPPGVLYTVAGTLFGGFFGGVLTLVGNLLGALICFKLARRYGRKFVDRGTNKSIQKKFSRFFERHGIWAIFILRINPLTTSDLISYLSGLTKIKTSKFLFATGAGLLPLIFLHTYFGDFIRNSPVLFGITIFVSFLYLIIFIYLIFFAILKKNEK